MKTIAIIGSRRRATVQDALILSRKFDEIYEAGDKIVSGGCPKGGDFFAEGIARRRGITIIVHHADWNGPLGKGAGLARNTTIAEDGDIFLCLVAHDRTGGTEDTIRKAIALGKEIVLL